MKRIVALFGAVFVVIYSVIGATVTNVRGVQQSSGSKLVDIYYDLNGAEGETYTVEAVLEGATEAVKATSLTGDVGKGIKSGQNRHIVWDAGADWMNKKGFVKAVVTATREFSSGVQLWEGGPYWADRNIGAEKPEDYGYYFWWGDTVGYKRENDKWVATDGSSSNFSFDRSTTPTHDISNSWLQHEGWIVSNDDTYVLAPEHDAAHVQWGGDWRMPTYLELFDLCKLKCDWTWTSKNGVNGYVVRGKGDYADKSIFLPCAGEGNGREIHHSGSKGYYWSSVPYSQYYDNGAYYISFNSSDRRTYNLYRYKGRSVRPVTGFTKSFGVTGNSEYFYVNTTDVKVKLVSNEGVIIGEDGNPVKDADGNFVTEVMQVFERNKFVSIMKNPFKRGNNIFLGWSRYPDIDLRKEVYENRKSLEEVLASDEYMLYFDIENPEEEVTLYAIWTVSLTCSFLKYGSQ